MAKPRQGFGRKTRTAYVFLGRYAETFAERFRGFKGHPYEQGFDLRLVPKKLSELWRSPKLVFVNSMSDLFHDAVPEEYIEAVCRVMVKAKWHTFQVLTKDRHA